MTTYDFAELRIIDDPLAPSIVADAVTGVRATNGLVRINFERWHPDYSADPQTITRVCVGRLFIGLEGAEILARRILDFVAAQREQEARTLEIENTAH